MIFFFPSFAPAGGWEVDKMYLIVVYLSWGKSTALIKLGFTGGKGKWHFSRYMKIIMIFIIKYT